MKRELTLLLTSSGRRVELLRCFKKDAEILGIRLRTVAVDLNPELSAVCNIADHSIKAPHCGDSGYTDFLINLCSKEHINILIPTIDPELSAVSAVRERLSSSTVLTVISSQEVVRLARDKLLTARALAAAGIRTPQTVAFTKATVEAELQYPFIVKPRSGSSSQGIHIVRSARELATLKQTDNLIAQELLKGPEYTVNMYFDGGGSLKCVIPHLRIETRAGEVSKAETVRIPELEKIGWKLGDYLKGGRGPICFQAIILDDGMPALFEINARFGGGYPIAHHAGAPFTRWILEEAAGIPSTASNLWRDGARMLRFDSAVFV